MRINSTDLYMYRWRLRSDIMTQRISDLNVGEGFQLIWEADSRKVAKGIKAKGIIFARLSPTQIGIGYYLIYESFFEYHVCKAQVDCLYEIFTLPGQFACNKVITWVCRNSALQTHSCKKPVTTRLSARSKEVTLCTTAILDDFAIS